jgi:hypothetical protein
VVQWLLSMTSRFMILAGACLILLMPFSAMAVTVLASTVTYDEQAQIFDFSITFSGAPDFFTVDSFGRPAVAFQYYIFFNGVHGRLNADSDSLVRGSEIHFAGDLRIRDGLKGGSSSDPEAGGWGPLRGAVPFALVGPELSFSAPLAIVGDSDGHFAYRLFTFEFGRTTYPRVDGWSNGVTYPIPVPEPSALQLILVGLLVACASARRPALRRGIISSPWVGLASSPDPRPRLGPYSPLCIRNRAGRTRQRDPLAHPNRAR